MKVPSSSVALVVVDMQNGFCHPEGSFSLAGADVSGCTAAIPATAELIARARRAGIPIIATRAIHEPGLRDWNMLTELPLYAGLTTLVACEEGSWDAEFVDGVDLAGEAWTYSKSRFSPFVETSIEEDLKQRGIENLVVCGVGTSACVESTVRDASQRSFRCFVVAEATGDISPTAHENSLGIMGGLFGYTVSLSDVGDAWAEVR